jgi:AcrR family transcriptional regulator
MPDISSSPRDRIIDAAFAAFMQFGYEGANTNEIARLARVSKRDLYAHFPSKRAMLEGCITERVESMRPPLDLPVPDNEESLRETLVHFGTTFLLGLSQPEVLATHRLAILNAEIAPDVAQTLDRFGRTGTVEGLIGFLTPMCERGLLAGAGTQEMAEVFFAILMRGGILLRMVMRVADPPTEAEARARAELAADSLWGLYGRTR